MLNYQYRTALVSTLSGIQGLQGSALIDPIAGGVYIISGGVDNITTYSHLQSEKNVSLVSVLQKPNTPPLDNHADWIIRSGTRIHAAWRSLGTCAYTISSGVLTQETELLDSHAFRVFSDGTYIYIPGSSGFQAMTYTGSAYTPLATLAFSVLDMLYIGGYLIVLCALGMFDYRVRAYTFNGSSFTYVAEWNDSPHTLDRIFKDSNYIYVVDYSSGSGDIGTWALSFNGSSFTQLGTMQGRLSYITTDGMKLTTTSIVDFDGASFSGYNYTGPLMYSPSGDNNKFIYTTSVVYLTDTDLPGFYHQSTIIE